MTTKARIVDLLGEGALTLPAKLGEAVVANERAKYVLSLLQLAATHADNEGAPANSLQRERQACGISDRSLDAVATETEGDGKGNYAIPQTKRLREILTDSLQAMIAPLALAERASLNGATDYASYTQRLTSLQPTIDALADGFTTSETISSLTSGRPSSGDGVHLLVMDLHRELNELIEKLSEETIAGAHVYHVGPQDRPLVEAFMVGLNRTAPLKFDHPGLATSAIRTGEQLLIQNDIGETTAHVIVIAIAGLSVSLTYTDVHLQRLRFLQVGLENTGLTWNQVQSRQATGLGKEDLFYANTGRLEAASPEQLCEFLEQLGSRIVFLIDWNKARKTLGLMVPNALAVDLLKWAADHDHGHRAFLQLGGERLIYGALESAVRTPLRYGEPLHEMIGMDAARDFLRFALEATATGLRDGRSAMLISDRIKVELFNHFRSAEHRLLADASRHASLIVQLARGLEGIFTAGVATEHDRRVKVAAHAKALESEADEIVKATRSTSQRIAGTAVFCRTLEIADDAADALEEASFLAGLLGAEGPALAPPGPLAELASLAAAAGRAFQQLLELAPQIHRGAPRDVINTFLSTIEELISLEHRTDAKEREALTVLVGAASDWRQLHVLAGVARHLEQATDALLHAGLMIRNHLLGEIMFA